MALAADTEGVHVGQTDMPVKTARKLMGCDKIVGATTKTVSQATEAYEQGADYLASAPYIRPQQRSRQFSHPRILSGKSARQYPSR